MASVYTLSSPSSAIADPLTIGSLYATSVIRNAGIEQINSATKPTTRIDGSALIADDLWYDTTANLEYYWNGTSFLSKTLRYANVSTNFANSGVVPLQSPNCFPVGSNGDNKPIFLESISYQVSLSGTVDTVNYYTLQPYVIRASGGQVAVSGTSAINLQSPVNNARLAIGLALPSYTGNPAVAFIAYFTKFGAGSNIVPAVVTFEFRDIAR